MSSIIAVPRRATLHDVVQHVMCMDAVGLSNDDGKKGLKGTSKPSDAGSARIPSDHRFWKSLRLAVKQHPEATQSGRRMLRVHESTTNETLIIEQEFLKDFVAAYEADATYQVTVAQEQQLSGTAAKSTVGLRTFFCNQEFWDHVLMSYASTVSGGGAQSPSNNTTYAGPYDSIVLSVRITRVEHRSSSEASLNASAAAAYSRKIPTWLQNLATLQLTVGEWNAVVAAWNRLHVAPADDNTAASPVPGESAPPPTAHPQDPQEDVHEGESMRRRSQAVFGADSSYDLVAEARARLDDLSKGSAKANGSRYWTHFMFHWGLLEAQYRNYL